MRKLTALLPSAIILFLVCSTAFGQLTEIKNTVPKSVPIEVEFRNQDTANWWHDLEIRVTNKGQKPIYHLWLILWLDSENPVTGRKAVMSFSFGDVKKFYPADSPGIADSADSSIGPGETFIFQPDAAHIKYWDLVRQRGDLVEPHKAELDHGGTRFGDGTGLESGGSPIKKKRSRPTL